MLKEIPETLMLCVFAPLQHDLGTDAEQMQYMICDAGNL